MVKENIEKIMEEMGNGASASCTESCTKFKKNLHYVFISVMNNL